jgi:hypothetical protein
VHGLRYSREYYGDVLAPLLDRHRPGIVHGAARLGSGSDVLGLDDDTSRDHDWGLRVTLFVAEHAVDDVDELLERMLPTEYRGHPTRFATTWRQEPHHGVEVTTIGRFTRERLGVDATRELDVGDWLSLTGQAVLEVTAGEVFDDPTGELASVRNRLRWYPDAVWRHVVAADWARIGQELPFIGRAGERGDDLGSRLIAARLVRVAMHLGFLLERRWPPYPKWFGTLFADLPRAAALAPQLLLAVRAETWREREDALCEALERLNALQRENGLPAAERATQPFFDRPFRGASDISRLVGETISDPVVAALPPGVGAIEQWVDNVDVLTASERRAAVARAVIGR